MKKRREPGIYRPLPGPGPLGPPPSSPIDLGKSYVHSRPAPSTGAPTSRNTSTEEFWVVGETYDIELSNGKDHHLTELLEIKAHGVIVGKAWHTFVGFGSICGAVKSRKIK